MTEKITTLEAEDRVLLIETSRFGTIEVDEDRIINFPDGLLGFPDTKRYLLMDYKDTPLKWLQSVDDPNIAFIVVEPEILNPESELSPDNATKKFLRLENDEDLAVLVIIRVENDSKVIANYRGPLYLNANLMIGVQVVLDKP